LHPLFFGDLRQFGVVRKHLVYDGIDLLLVIDGGFDFLLGHLDVGGRLCLLPGWLLAWCWRCLVLPGRLLGRGDGHAVLGEGVPMCSAAGWGAR